MERFPESYKGRKIIDRVPYTMHGDQTVAASTSGQLFPEATFLHNIGEPFEIHRVKINVVSLDSGADPQADPSNGDIRHWIRVTMKSRGGSKMITKNATRLISLVNNETNAWEWEWPYTLEQSEGFEISLDNNIAVGDAAGGVRIELNFQGYLLVLGQ